MKEKDKSNRTSECVDWGRLSCYNSRHNSGGLVRREDHLINDENQMVWRTRKNKGLLPDAALTNNRLTESWEISEQVAQGVKIE